MPQLDKVTFLSQFFWLCVFFFWFYVFSLKHFLPEMSRILKFRKRRLDEQSQPGVEQENNNVRTSGATLLENGATIFQQICKESSRENDKLLTKYSATVNQNNLKKGNDAYFQSSGKELFANIFGSLYNTNDFSNQSLFSQLKTGLSIQSFSTWSKEQSTQRASSNDVNSRIKTSKKLIKEQKSKAGNQKSSSIKVGSEEQSKKPKATKKTT